MSRVCVCESGAHPVFNQSSGGLFSSYTISVLLHLPAGIFYCMLPRKIITQQIFLSLKQNNSEDFIGAQ